MFQPFDVPSTLGWSIYLWYLLISFDICWYLLISFDIFHLWCFSFDLSVSTPLNGEPKTPWLQFGAWMEMFKEGTWRAEFSANHGVKPCFTEHQALVEKHGKTGENKRNQRWTAVFERNCSWTPQHSMSSSCFRIILNRTAVLEPRNSKGFEHHLQVGERLEGSYLGVSRRFPTIQSGKRETFQAETVIHFRYGELLTSATWKCCFSANNQPVLKSVSNMHPPVTVLVEESDHTMSPRGQ